MADTNNNMELTEQVNENVEQTNEICSSLKISSDLKTLGACNNLELAMTVDRTSFYINVIREGTDFSVITATPEVIRAGYKTYNSAGELITGTIPDATASVDGNVITVPKGFHENQTITIPKATVSRTDNTATVTAGYLAEGQTFTFEGYKTNDATVTAEQMPQGVIAYGVNGRVTGTAPTVSLARSGNKVSIGKGFVPANDSLTIPEAPINETDNSVSIGTGYVSQAKEYTFATGAEIYKCASVDVANKTWTGYKAVLTDGEYSFEETATPDLTFTAVTPAVGKYYTADALMSITSVWQGYLAHLSADGEDGWDISRYAHGVFINDPDMVVAENGAFSFGGGYMGIDPLGDEFVFGTGDFTIEAKITPQSSDMRQCFCAYHNDGVFAVCYSYDNDGKLGVFWRGSWSCHTWDCVLTAGQEYHIAIVRSGNKLQLFVDNELQLTRDGTKYWDVSGVSVGESGQSFYFGRWGGDPGDFGNRWQGSMHDMKIANAALYAEMPPTPKMVFYAPLSEAKTTAETGQTLETDGDVTFTTFDGKACVKIGEPYETTGYIKTVENIGITGQSSRTVSFWAHPTNEQEYCNAVGWGLTQSHGRLFNCGAANWGALYAEFTTWGNDIQHEFAVDDGKLHHFCYVYDEDKPETLVIYVDGVKNTFNVSGIATQDSPLWIGQSGAGGWNYTGHLADVRIYNYALSENEVKILAGVTEGDIPGDTGLKVCAKCGSSNLKLEGSNMYRCQDCGTGHIANGFDPNGYPKYDVVVTRCVLCQTPLAQSQIKECSICTNQVCENCGDTLGTGAWQCYGC